MPASQTIAAASTQASGALSFTAVCSEASSSSVAPSDSGNAGSTSAGEQRHMGIQSDGCDQAPRPGITLCNSPTGVAESDTSQDHRVAATKPASCPPVADKRASFSSSSSSSSLSAASINSGASLSALSSPPKSKRPRFSVPIKLPDGKDRFCWLCHGENASIPCSTCPRSFHEGCLSATGETPLKHTGTSTVGCASGKQAPLSKSLTNAAAFNDASPMAASLEAAVISSDTEEQDSFVCRECLDSARVEKERREGAPPKTPLEVLNPEQLSEVLLVTVRSIRPYALDIFYKPVSLEEYPDYKDFVVYPFDLQEAEVRVLQKRYVAVEQFVSDLRWIHHNSVAYNGSQNRVSSSAAALLKAADNDIAEMSLCPQCYMHKRSGGNHFSEICSPPHVIVWAKLRGFPHWPAKVMRVDGDQVTVRFFGDYNKGTVAFSNCTLLTLRPPANPKSKKGQYSSAMDEMSTYVKRFKERFGVDFQFETEQIKLTRELFEERLNTGVCLAISSLKLKHEGSTNAAAVAAISATAKVVLGAVATAAISASNTGEKNKEQLPDSPAKALFQSALATSGSGRKRPSGILSPQLASKSSAGTQASGAEFVSEAREILTRPAPLLEHGKTSGHINKTQHLLAGLSKVDNDHDNVEISKTQDFSTRSKVRGPSEQTVLALAESNKLSAENANLATSVGINNSENSRRTAIDATNLGNFATNEVQQRATRSSLTVQLQAKAAETLLSSSVKVAECLSFGERTDQQAVKSDSCCQHDGDDDDDDDESRLKREIFSRVPLLAKTGMDDGKSSELQTEEQNSILESIKRKLNLDKRLDGSLRSADNSRDVHDKPPAPEAAPVCKDSLSPEVPIKKLSESSVSNNVLETDSFDARAGNASRSRRSASCGLTTGAVKENIKLLHSADIGLADDTSASDLGAPTTCSLASNAVCNSNDGNHSKEVKATVCALIDSKPSASLAESSEICRNRLIMGASPAFEVSAVLEDTLLIQASLNSTSGSEQPISALPHLTSGTLENGVTLKQDVGNLSDNNSLKEVEECSVTSVVKRTQSSNDTDKRCCTLVPEDVGAKNGLKASSTGKETRTRQQQQHEQYANSNSSKGTTSLSEKSARQSRCARTTRETREQQQEHLQVPCTRRERTSSGCHSSFRNLSAESAPLKSGSSQGTSDNRSSSNHSKEVIGTRRRDGTGLRQLSQPQPSSPQRHYRDRRQKDQQNEERGQVPSKCSFASVLGSSQVVTTASGKAADINDTNISLVLSPAHTRKCGKIMEASASDSLPKLPLATIPSHSGVALAHSELISDLNRSDQLELPSACSGMTVAISKDQSNSPFKVQVTDSTLSIAAGVQRATHLKVPEVDKEKNAATLSSLASDATGEERTSESIATVSLESLLATSALTDEQVSHVIVAPVEVEAPGTSRASTTIKSIASGSTTGSLENAVSEDSTFVPTIANSVDENAGRSTPSFAARLESAGEFSSIMVQSPDGILSLLPKASFAEPLPATAAATVAAAESITSVTLDETACAASRIEHTPMTGTDKDEPKLNSSSISKLNCGSPIDALSTVAINDSRQVAFSAVRLAQCASSAEHRSEAADETIGDAVDCGRQQLSRNDRDLHLVGRTSSDGSTTNDQNHRPATTAPSAPIAENCPKTPEKQALLGTDDTPKSPERTNCAEVSSTTADADPPTTVIPKVASGDAFFEKLRQTIEECKEKVGVTELAQLQPLVPLGGPASSAGGVTGRGIATDDEDAVMERLLRVAEPEDDDEDEAGDYDESETDVSDTELMPYQQKALQLASPRKEVAGGSGTAPLSGGDEAASLTGSLPAAATNITVGITATLSASAGLIDAAATAVNEVDSDGTPIGDSVNHACGSGTGNTVYSRVSATQHCATQTAVEMDWTVGMPSASWAGWTVAVVHPADRRLNQELVAREICLMKDKLKLKEMAVQKALWQASAQRMNDVVKSKQWCCVCKNLATMTCCWNTSYCSQACQGSHWPVHIKTCERSQSGKR